ncbi:DEAD/DEAH box helicase [Candidatus Thorarchaeota archaeon]|nr:MAG: DEAD/DEAH box helicase [Candidatus Thorarchaeota archaeon]
MTSTVSLPDHVTRILEEVGITPRGIQVQSIEEGLLLGESILVSSPTGSGKTLVGEMGLLRAVLDGRKGLYLVPLRALAHQVARSLKERYDGKAVRIGVTTGDLHLRGDEMANYDIIVTTYERADSLLRHQTDWLEEIGTVVIDEVQTLSDGRRGARLESVILRLKKTIDDVQLISLSATVEQPQELASWLGSKLVSSSERPVPLVYKMFTTSNRPLAVRKATMAVVQSEGQVIVFHRTRREAEAEAERLAEHVGRQLGAAERGSLDREIGGFDSADSKMSGHLRKLLHNGIAFHHAGMASSSRYMVEDLFRRGLVRVICATTTLASGMHLPARTVVLTGTRSPEDYRSMLRANSVHQMLGRAGRPGYDSTGFGVILVSSRGEADMVKKLYFHVSEEDGRETLNPRYDPVESALGTSEYLTEQALVMLDLLGEASPEEIEDLLTESYFVHCGSRRSRSPMRLLVVDSVNAETAIERHGLNDTIRAAREGVLGRATMREASQEVLGGIVSGFQGGHFTCRFSARMNPNGSLEGATCSCGNPMEEGILCVHLVSLGLHAARAPETRDLANYVIPLALDEHAPIGALTRLGLVEAGKQKPLRISRLGRIVSRLYLSISTVREMLACLPFTDDSVGLMSLLRHLVSIESNLSLDESFVQFVGTMATTSTPIRDVAEDCGIPLGDAFGLLDRSRWLLYAINVLAEHGGLQSLQETSGSLLRAIDIRLDGRFIDGDD